MSLDAIGQLFEAIPKNEDLEKKLSQASDVKDVIQVAKEAGFDVTPEDLASISSASLSLFQASRQPKLAYERLEAVTGLIAGSTTDSFNLGEGLLLVQKAMRLKEISLVGDMP